MEKEAGQFQWQLAAEQLQIFLGPFERWVDAQIDRRLARPFKLPADPSSIDGILAADELDVGVLIGVVGRHGPLQGRAYL